MVNLEELSKEKQEEIEQMITKELGYKKNSKEFLVILSALSDIADFEGEWLDDKEVEK